MKTEGIEFLFSSALFLQVVQVFTGAMSQHCGLLHQSSNGEKDLHAVHGHIQSAVHLHVYLRDDLPHRQAHLQIGEGPPRERADPVRRAARAHQHGPTQVPVSRRRPHTDGEPDEFEQTGEDQSRYCHDDPLGLRGQQSLELSQHKLCKHLEDSNAGRCSEEEHHGGDSTFGHQISTSVSCLIT